MNSIIKSNIIGLGFFFGLSAVLISVTNHYILTVNFFDFSGEYLAGSPGQESEVYNNIQKYVYLSTIIYTLLKLFLISLILYTALYLADIPVTFSSTFNIALTSEFIFLIPAVIKIIWFKHNFPHGTLTDWRNLEIFSGLSFFDRVSEDWHYPLQVFNLFEVGYWFLLAYRTHKSTKLTFDHSLRIVLYSYLPALLVWIAFVSFCTVMIFPSNA